MRVILVMKRLMSSRVALKVVDRMPYILPPCAHVGHHSNAKTFAYLTFSSVKMERQQVPD